MYDDSIQRATIGELKVNFDELKNIAFNGFISDYFKYGYIGEAAAFYRADDEFNAMLCKIEEMEIRINSLEG